MQRVQRRLLRSRPDRQAGLISSSLGLALLVLAGSAAIVAGALSLQNASVRGGDAEQAREAAEEGFNRVIDLLNDPGNSYLLVTKWANWSSNQVSAQDRQLCNITSSSAGATSIAIITQMPTPLPSVGNGRQLRYTLESYTPPAHPGAEPTSCTKFGNLAGGTASLRVLGEVLRNGSVIASFRLNRDVTVEAEPDRSGDPLSPPLAALGTGGGASTRIDIKSSARLSIDANYNWKHDTNENTQSVYCLGQTASDCKSGSSSLNSLPGGNTVQGYTVADFLNLFPASPPYPNELLGVTASDPTSTSNRPNFPYSSGNATLSNTNLRSSCRLAYLPTQIGSNEQVIACKISNFILEGIDLVVHTDRNNIPIVLYLSSNSYELKESGSSPGRIVNKRFSDTRATNPPQNHGTWSLLRIYGDPTVFPYSVGSSGECNATQTLKLIKGSSIDGAFLWVPRGEVIFDKPESPAYSTFSQYGLFGTVWSCKLKMEDNAVLLTNGTPSIVSQGIDNVFGISRFRYSARGVERSQ